MEKIKSKHEQILETLPPSKSAETIDMINFVIELEKEMEQYHFERQRKIKEAEDDLANFILTA